MNERQQELVRRRLAAILAADVVGYSRLMERDEEGTLRALKALRSELTDPKKIKERRGRIVKTMGDGLLVEFASVVDAVCCTVEVKQQIAVRNAGIPPDRRIVMRIGINLGDIILDERDVFGDGVNIAARLEGLADPGGICVSQLVRDQVRGKLDFTLEDLGERQVKNITHPVHVFCIAMGATAPKRAARAAASTATPVRYQFRRSTVFLASAILAITVAFSINTHILTWDHASASGSDGSENDQQTNSKTVIGDLLMFARAKISLSPVSLSAIDRQAAFLQTHPDIMVKVQGYSSEHEDPDVLARLRAGQVAAALKARGVAGSRIETGGHGGKSPPGVDEAQDRRVLVLRN